MPKKRTTLAKHTIRTIKGGVAGRLVVNARLLDLADTRPSKEAIKRIERLETSTARMQQRLGLIRLS